MDFSAEVDEPWGLEAATLSVEVTSFGTRGSLKPSISAPAPRNRSERPVAPYFASSPLLSWPIDEGCGDPSGEEGSALYPADTEQSRALHEAR